MFAKFPIFIVVVLHDITKCSFLYLKQLENQIDFTFHTWKNLNLN